MRNRLLLAAPAVAFVALLAGAAPGRSTIVGATPTGPRAAGSSQAVAADPACPWTSPPPGTSPGRLAAEVLARMTLADKLDVITLTSSAAYENATIPVPALCLPALTLEDGPDGLAYYDTGVTQFPAAIGLAATFDPSLAYAEGAAIGQQAADQGVDAIQGPYLNLARVPQAGRVFEGFGEDPLLAGMMGADDVEGIQSAGVMADVKDLGIYTQESDRDFLDQTVSTRALEELYLAPFRDVVEAADPASIMCGFGSINGVQTCEDPEVFAAMRADGFTGFFRDDINGAPDGSRALRAGLDLFKPSLESTDRGVLLGAGDEIAEIDAAAKRVLTEMFRFDLIQTPRTGKTATPVQNPTEESVGLAVAEQGAVLLKDADGALPIAPGTSSIAVIGTPAEAIPLSSGGGSSHVIAAHVVTPLAALRATWPKAAVTAVAGEPAAAPAGEIPDGEVTPALPVVPPPPKHPIYHTNKPPTGTWRSWTGTLRAPASGWYRISVISHGDTYVSIDRDQLLADPGTHGPTDIQLGFQFRAGRRYTLHLRWFDYDGNVPKIGWQDASPMIAAAAKAAARASVAVVFAGNESTEGADNPSLGLAGVQDELIAAVARANPRTVVVLDTGGAVLMPWLASVRGVLEAWYPGQDDGAAVAALLAGTVDPSGRLPVTFPRSGASTSVPTAAQWPGVDNTVDLDLAGDDGLDVGYRYYEAHHVAVLFPFGAGGSYTSFTLSDLELSPLATTSGAPASAALVATVSVRNTGHRAGTEVVELYLKDPPAADEPPEQLVGFAPIDLRPGASGRVDVEIPDSAFEVWRAGAFRVLPGRYVVSAGTSSASLTLERTLDR